ncbi:hypothetical protein ACLOJK_000327 [Asimina triloba]
MIIIALSIKSCSENEIKVKTNSVADAAIEQGGTSETIASAAVAQPCVGMAAVAEEDGIMTDSVSTVARSIGGFKALDSRRSK